MTLRVKTFIILTIVSVALLFLQSAGAKLVLDSSYRKLEEKDARRNLSRVQNLFQESLEQMGRSIGGLAHLTETYRFMKGEGELEKRYLTQAQFEHAKWDFLLLVDREGHVKLSKAYDASSHAFVSPPSALQKTVSKDLRDFQPRDTRGSLAGVWMVDRQAYMFASQWILSSELGGEPAGVLIAGRAITPEVVKLLSEKLRLDIHLAHVYGGVDRDDQDKIARATTDLQQPKFFDIDVDFTRLFLDIKDYRGQAAIQLEVILKRDFHQQARANSFYLFATVLLVGCAFSALVYLIMDRMVLARISKLSQDIVAVKAAESFDVRVRTLGHDELGGLADTINEMLQAQGKMHALLEIEQKKTEDLLLNILPRQVVDRLKEDSSAIAERFNDVTILFADIVGFTQLSATISPEELVNTLNSIFTGFDQLVQKHGLEKIKTIGDAYMVVGGLPERRSDHVQAVASLALDMQAFMEEYNQRENKVLQIRTGIHSGPVVAGVIGTRKFLYDLWGDAVNTASRMESSGLPGSIQVTMSTYHTLKAQFELEPRGQIEVKGKGLMDTFFLKKKKLQSDQVA
jgi:adenylate cyclase